MKEPPLRVCVCVCVSGRKNAMREAHSACVCACVRVCMCSQCTSTGAHSQRTREIRSQILGQGISPECVLAFSMAFRDHCVMMFESGVFQKEVRVCVCVCVCVFDLGVFDLLRDRVWREDAAVQLYHDAVFASGVHKIAEAIAR